MHSEVKAWPFQEARKILERLNGHMPEKGYVLFETGYGPSGLPHIGTFAEVVRTCMVRQAFTELSKIPSKLYVFSDDRDGLRKVPDNVPNRELLEANIGKALTSVPDPFNAYNSFGDHNNAMLRRFLDSYNFEYEFQSATQWYTAGRFDHVILKMAENYEKLQSIMLPTLGKDRRASYSIFMPVTSDGRVLQVPVVSVNPDTKTLVYLDENNINVEIPLDGNHVKLQWKADWAARWYAFDVDYEMFGKDLIPTAELSRKINKAIGGNPPVGFNYELFLDINGEKISKTKGNGLSIEDWLRYGSKESLVYYMFHTPGRAKKLAYPVIPKCVDDYHSACLKYDDGTQDPRENPAWYIHRGGNVKLVHPDITYTLILNLIGSINTLDKEVVFDYIAKYNPLLTVENYPYLDEMVAGAIAYYEDNIRPTKSYRVPTESEKVMLKDMADVLFQLSDLNSDEEIQAQIYEVGKRHYAATELRMFFKAVYEILLGQTEGPRMGAFVKLYGRQNTVDLIHKILQGETI